MYVIKQGSQTWQSPSDFPSLHRFLAPNESKAYSILSSSKNAKKKKPGAIPSYFPLLHSRVPSQPAGNWQIRSSACAMIQLGRDRSVCSKTGSKCENVKNPHTPPSASEKGVEKTFSYLPLFFISHNIHICRLMIKKNMYSCTKHALLIYTNCIIQCIYSSFDFSKLTEIEHRK